VWRSSSEPPTQRNYLECWRGCPPASSLPKEPRITNADLTDQERKTVLEGPPKPF